MGNKDKGCLYLETIGLIVIAAFWKFDVLKTSIFECRISRRGMERGFQKLSLCGGWRCRDPQTFHLFISFVPNQIRKTQTLLPGLSLACVDAALDIESARLRNKI